MTTDWPVGEAYDDVEVDTLDLESPAGPTNVLLYRPTRGAAARPAVVVAHDGTGRSTMNRSVAAALAHDGYLVAMPDYYHGSGPADPDSLADLVGLMDHIGSIDFAAETRMFGAVIDAVRGRHDVAEPLAVWGYCTGGTLALLTACIRSDVAAAVLFYPSQALMPIIDERHPVHPIDLLWSMRGPALLLAGDRDFVLPETLVEELRRRAETWNVDLDIVMFAGAGHAFATPVDGFYHEQAAAESWRAARSFLDRAMGVNAPLT